MMLAKMAAPGLLKIIVFWDKASVGGSGGGIIFLEKIWRVSIFILRIFFEKVLHVTGSLNI